MSYRGGATDTHNALTHVRTHMFTKENGDRPAAENVLVVMTDGGSSIPEETITEIYNLKRQNVTIYVVPVGNCKLYWGEIHTMATSSQHVITDLNHIDTFTAARLLWKQICRGI
ncbi:von Willebrand factor A domain-containing protein 2-like [Saccostrea cucullata]|uniref:von Willebrand factor A domain-containing protein 2-like n=1 Tax=Saccostrea cuccullata TaxID=36930 RepID=UPI002ED2300D